MSLIREFASDRDNILIAGLSILCLCVRSPHQLADCQNMVNRRALMEFCRGETLYRYDATRIYLPRPAIGTGKEVAIQYTKPQTLPQFMLFIEQLPNLLSASPKVGTVCSRTAVSYSAYDAGHIACLELHVDPIPNDGAQSLKQNCSASETQASACEADHREPNNGGLSLSSF